MLDLIVVGLGELGRLYAGGALRLGYRVTPVTRTQFLDDQKAELPEGSPVLVAVGEEALPLVLEWLPPSHHEHVILLQNELFASSWSRLEAEPTVFVPWLLQKRGSPLKVMRPTPVHGAHAHLVLRLHDVLSLPAFELDDVQARDRALAEKYVFILTINALGLTADRSVVEFATEQTDLVESIAREASALASRFAGVPDDPEAAINSTIQAMMKLGDVSARGRTALVRVERALEAASERGFTLRVLRQIYDEANRG